MFYPGRVSQSAQFTVGLGFGPLTAKLDTSTQSSALDQATITLLNQVIRHLEREAVHFLHSDLRPGRWIFFDLNMGYGTSYRDKGSPPEIDDVALFYGSCDQVEARKQSAVDLLLCGSSEHLLTRTASAGRMGSGTEWLYSLIKEVEKLDALGTEGSPDSLKPHALSASRINSPEEIAWWVFNVVRMHHSPDHYARLQGFARVLFVVPATEHDTRLVLATPLFVQLASSKPFGLLVRLRMQRELSRRHGLRLRKWRPSLPPEDREKVYLPLADRNSDTSPAKGRHRLQ
jgi:hypothetical protein